MREDYSMPNSSENDDTAGWVMGDLPGDKGRPDEDARLNAEALEASATNDDNQPPPIGTFDTSFASGTSTISLALQGFQFADYPATVTLLGLGV